MIIVEYLQNTRFALGFYSSLSVISKPNLCLRHHFIGFYANWQGLFDIQTEFIAFSLSQSGCFLFTNIIPTYNAISAEDVVRTQTMFRSD